ncbi:hypothetical protein [Kribbella jiaozuonensis]|uniref:Uncharacterized protein n=1 Tax=Kribbella jiaozuonensis TaxID=2575441 RepID=A0A4U3LJK3_9ACTN|nr:hypothetical protein [Kribbella jiaozuonensis]TKK75229.1 hypothetical protein FDA38_32945 [Kribbella jiaozuonensis]
MSSIVPGPQKKLEQEIDAARSGAKPLQPSDLNTSAPPQEELTGLDDWPESLRSAVEAEHARVVALATNRRRTADRVLPDVVHGLDQLLDEIADRLQSQKPGLFGKSSAQADADDDIADLLGIPTDELTSPGRGEHRAALRTIKQLRSQLKELETSHEHSKLTRLVTFVVRLAVVTDSAPESTATLAPIALDRYAKSSPDTQWDWPFDQKLDFWKQTRTTLTPNT